jgi:hypothetical protein
MTQQKMTKMAIAKDFGETKTQPGIDVMISLNFAKKLAKILAFFEDYCYLG